jgi:hypothetical protein
MSSLPADARWFETAWFYLTSVVHKFGLPMMVGCVPWALLVSWIGYRWSLRLIVRRRARQAERRRRRHDDPRTALR